MTTRLTMPERKVFRQHAAHNQQPTPPEPMMGSIGEQLDILIRRFGGKTRIILSANERAELRAFQQ